MVCNSFEIPLLKLVPLYLSGWDFKSINGGYELYFSYIKRGYEMADNLWFGMSRTVELCMLSVMISIMANIYCILSEAFYYLRSYIWMPYIYPRCKSNYLIINTNNLVHFACFILSQANPRKTLFFCPSKHLEVKIKRWMLS